MLFFNVVLLAVAGLASAQIDLLKANIGLRNMNYGPRSMMFNQAHPSWINSGSILDAAQFAPVMYADNGYHPRGMIVGRGVGFGGSRIHLLDNQHHQARTLGLLNARQHHPYGARLMRETEGTPIGMKHFEDESPKPYAFAYDTSDEYNNKMARQEQQDENGRVTGSYSYLDANGLMRRVDYVADEQGFRADVKTNEPGTATSVTGAALIQSAAPSAEAIAAVAGPKHIGHPAQIAPIGPIPQLEKIQLEKTPVVVRSMDGSINPSIHHLQALKADEQKLALSGLQAGPIADGNILSLAQAKGFEVNPNFMRFALPSIAQSFGPASLVKIADPAIGEQFLKAAAAAAAV